MPKNLTIGFAVFFVGLQIATLFHSAQFGFLTHSHAPSQTLISDPTALASLNASTGGLPHNEREHTASCDLEFFCEKLDKWAAVSGSDLISPASFNPAILAAPAPPVEVRFEAALARGPPVTFHS
ncbi:MAG: hypothetical protein COA62_14285 [Rhodobiaceae bacterium]|nr:MAG: hypothetical protein COA62_14285 [Rhodobiaceae bacterium]